MGELSDEPSPVGLKPGFDQPNSCLKGGDRFRWNQPRVPLEPDWTTAPKLRVGCQQPRQDAMGELFALVFEPFFPSLNAVVTEDASDSGVIGRFNIAKQ